MIQLQSLGRESAIICHNYLWLVGTLGVLTHANTRLPPLIFPSLIQATLSLYKAPCDVACLAYLLKSYIPIPFVPTTLGLIQLLLHGVDSNIQFLHLGISLDLRISIILPPKFILLT